MFQVETIEPVTLSDKIATHLSSSDRALHIKEIAENFIGIPESTVRGRLNENVGKLFERVGKGLYILKSDKSTIGLINGDARKLDDKFDSNSVDLILSDHAWLDEKSHKGGTRNFASSYDCFHYEQEDFTQKARALKSGGFLVEILPEKNSNNRVYLRAIEDMAEKAGLDYFCEVAISGGNSNIGRKKKFISSAYFFTKGDARKLKVWDEKISEMTKNGDFQFLQKEHLIDFKKVYSDVMAKDPDKLMGSFARHSVAKTIPSFKRAKTPEDMEVLRSAFVEYIDFLNAADSFKMGTRTTLPEMFIGKLPTSEEKVHESQKPINTLEEIILQTTEAGETVLEQFAGSFIGADAIISIGKDGQGWRDYFGIELDTEIFNKAVDRLKEKYKDFRFTTVDDFYNESISETAIVGTMEKTTFEAFEKLALVRDKINSDLSGVLEVRYENDADLRRDGMFAKDFEHNIAIVNVKIESRTGTKNLKIVADPSSNTFVLFDIGLDKIVNRTRPEQTLDVVLMKMYDTFRRK